MSGYTARASVLTSSGLRSFNGWGVTMSGSASICRFFAASRAGVMNAVVTIVEVGTPRFSR